MSDSYVYFIRSGKKFNSPVKIGVADDPSKRVLELQTGNANPLTVAMTIKTDSRDEAFRLERFFHEKLKNHKMVGEWFYYHKVQKFIKSILSEYYQKSGIIRVAEKSKPELSKGTARDRKIEEFKNKNRELRRLVAEKDKEIERLKMMIEGA